MFRHSLSFALLAAAPWAGTAQRLYMPEHPIAVATRDPRTFINNPSFRRFNFGYRDLIDNDQAVGPDIGWQTFFEKKDLGSELPLV